jgi:putative flavoprotein involved in K+ transport
LSDADSSQRREPSTTAAGVDNSRSSNDVDVIVVGAGQAGLAIGYHLARQQRRFLIIDAADAVGSAWRYRWDSLVLFTPRRYDALPGMPFPGNPNGYPTRDEVISYLTDYAATFELPLRLSSPVRSLTRSGSGFAVALDDMTLRAEQVVVATGPFHMPVVPAVAQQLDPGVFQTHSAGYSRPDDIPEGKVLVVGGGNTGFQIAKELSASRSVHLAVGSRQTPLPQTLLGRDLFWWLIKSHLIDQTVDSRFGSRLQHRDTLIGSSPRQLKRSGVAMRPRVLSAAGDMVTFADGSDLKVDAVIWATGYRPDHSWIDVGGLLRDGRVTHRRGVTDVPGLYFLGLTWQHTRGSALLGWVKDDADFIAGRIAAGADPTALPRRSVEKLPSSHNGG